MSLKGLSKTFSNLWMTKLKQKPDVLHSFTAMYHIKGFSTLCRTSQLSGACLNEFPIGNRLFLQVWFLGPTRKGPAVLLKFLLMFSYVRNFATILFFFCLPSMHFVTLLTCETFSVKESKSASDWAGWELDPHSISPTLCDSNMLGHKNQFAKPEVFNVFIFLSTWK